MKILSRRLFKCSADREAVVRPAAICLAGCVWLAGAGAAFSASTPAWEQRMLAWPTVVHHLTPPQDTQKQAKKWLASVLKNMAASANGLLAQNAGAPTQTAQKHIILSLDQLIKMAEQMNQGSGGGRQHHQQQQNGMAIQQTRGQGHGYGSTTSPSNAATRSYLPGGGAMPVQTGKPFESHKKQWGNLPPRARNLILNAMRNQSLPQYHGLVNAYYRALGRMNEKQ